MKKFILILGISLTLALSISAQTQTGFVKTRGRLGSNGKLISGNRIEGATIQVKGRSAVKSDKNGNFSFPIPANKFFIQSVKKQGYILVDPEATTRQYTYSSNPLILVLETPSQQTEEKLANERKIRRTLQRQLQAREDEIEALKEQNKITQDEYQKKLQQLYAEQENNEKLISDMAERYAQLDFDQMDEFNRQISDCILNGRLTEADSLLRTKGDINTRIARLNQHHEANKHERDKLEKSEAMEQTDREDIAQDCYRRFEIFLMNHQNDSAAYYLELRANLDTTNLDWQLQTGQFFNSFLANYQLARHYFNIGLHQAQKEYGEESEYTALFYNHIGLIYHNSVDYEKALEFHLKALNINEHVLGKEHRSTAMTYNFIGLVYMGKGYYDKALNYCLIAKDIREKLFGDMHLDIANSYNCLGSIYSLLMNYSIALEYYSKAIDIYQHILGDDNTESAPFYNNIGWIYDRIGNYPLALDYYFKALKLNEEIYGKENTNLAISYYNIGTAYSNQGDYPMALEYIQKFIDIKKRTPNYNQADLINTEKLALNLMYLSSLSTNQINDFLTNHCFVLSVVNAYTPASSQGMKGDYTLLEFADWREDSTIPLFEKNTNLQGMPKDIVVLKDGIISKHHFDNAIGAQLSVKEISTEERDQINQLYNKWKNGNK